MQLFRGRLASPLGDLLLVTDGAQTIRALGFADPRAAIDIGAARLANPVAIVVPCHRVTGRHGDLKGYAWGIGRRRWLLEHEGAISSQSARSRVASLAGR